MYKIWTIFKVINSDNLSNVFWVHTPIYDMFTIKGIRELQAETCPWVCKVWGWDPCMPSSRRY